MSGVWVLDVLSVVLLIGIFGATLLMLATITVARIAIADDIPLMGTLGISGIIALCAVIVYMIRWVEPIFQWHVLFIAGLSVMIVFAEILQGFLMRTIEIKYYTPDRPTWVHRKFPDLRTLSTVFGVAAVFVVLDVLTGHRGWGWFFGMVVMIKVTGFAWSELTFQWHFKERLADIDDFEPELLASLERGPISRHVLRIIRRWTETEESPE